MKYWEMDIEKGNKFNFLNEKVHEFTSRWSQSFVHWSKKPSNIVYEA